MALGPAGRAPRTISGQGLGRPLGADAARLLTGLGDTGSITLPISIADDASGTLGTFTLPAGKALEAGAVVVRVSGSSGTETFAATVSAAGVLTEDVAGSWLLARQSAGLIGETLSVRVTGLVLVDWTPADLFTGGVGGAYLDYRNAATLFQDAVATVPVTTLGDPIRIATDGPAVSRNTVGVGFEENMAAYNAVGHTVTTSEVPGPLAVMRQNANLVVPAAGTAAISSKSITANGVFAVTDSTVSVYAKSAGAQYLLIGTHNNSGLILNALFDIQNGTFVASSAHPTYEPQNISGSVEDVGGGWFRCVMRLQYNLLNTLLAIAPSTTYGGAYNRNVTGDGTSGAYVIGVQVERNVATASPYVRTGGNGNHAVAPNDAARPVRSSTGGVLGADFDAVDDYMTLAQGIPENTRVTFAMAYSPAARNWIAMSSSSNTPWFGVGHSGSESSIADGSTSFYSQWFNGVAFVGNRGESYTASQSANVLIAEAESTLAFPANAARIGQYAFGGGFTTPGPVHQYLHIDRALTADERVLLTNYFGADHGVSV